MIPKSYLEVSDFSGGKTDNILGAPKSKFKEAKNLLIEEYEGVGKLRIRDGSELFEPSPRPYTDPLTPNRIDYLKYVYFEYSGKHIVFAFTNESIYYSVDPGSGFNAWTELLGPTGGKLLTMSGDTYPISVSTWQDHVIVSCGLEPAIQIFDTGALNSVKAMTAGLPKVTAANFLPLNGSAGNTYLYRILYAYSYETGGKTYEQRGEYFEKAVVTGAEISGGNIVTISGIPSFVNSLGINFDTGSNKFVREIYRTSKGGQNFYHVASILNGTTSYVDSMSDTLLLTRPPLYTEGGLPQVTRPPPCYMNHVVENTGFYAGCIEQDATFVPTAFGYNRFYQSIPGAPLLVPATFYEDMPDDIMGFSSFRGLKVCMLKSGSVYRLDGGFDETGGGSYEKTEISTRAGCLGWNSVVQTDVGIFWAGFDGFYYTDGYRVIQISKSLPESYASITGSDQENRRLQGKYDPLTNRVWWVAQEGDPGDCTLSYVLHLDYGIKEDMPFTTVVGGDHYSNTALEFVGQTMIRGDRAGFVFRHEPGIGTDLYADPAVDPGLWVKEAILYDYLSAAHDFGSTSIRKFVTGLSVVCKNVTNLSLAIRSINDSGRNESELRPIRFRGGVTWGDPTIIWGDPTLVWNRNGVINEKRRFPAVGLRCLYKQVGFSNAKVAMLSSDFLGMAALAGGTLTRTQSWPTYLPGYVIAFEDDDFEREYRITSVDGNDLFFDVSQNTPFAALDKRWVVRGRPQGEYFFLSSYEIEYGMLSRSQKGYRSAETGEPEVIP